MTGQAKPKRVPKPARTPAVDVLLALIPFLNFEWNDRHRIANEEELLDLFRGAVRAVQPYFDDPAALKDATRWADQPAMLYVRETHRLITDMVRDLIREESVVTQQWYLLARKTIEEGIWINLLQNPLKMRIEPRVPKVTDNGERWRVIAETTRTLLVVAVVEGLGHDGPGRAYVGECKRCEKIFEKKHSDANFCSPACAGAERIARWRKRK